MSILVTPNFSWREFDCHDGTGVPDALKSAVTHLCETVLEPIRLLWGEPLIVVCGYRTEGYNEALRQAAIKAGRAPGQAKDSQHLRAAAADIRPVSMSRVSALAFLVEDMLAEGQLPGLGGLGVYPQWVHVDVRPRVNGHVARWAGAGVGSEP